MKKKYKDMLIYKKTVFLRLDFNAFKHSISNLMPGSHANRGSNRFAVAYESHSSSEEERNVTVQPFDDNSLSTN